MAFQGMRLPEKGMGSKNPLVGAFRHCSCRLPLAWLLKYLRGVVRPAVFLMGDLSPRLAAPDSCRNSSGAKVEEELLVLANFLEILTL